MNTTPEEKYIKNIEDRNVNLLKLMKNSEYHKKKIYNELKLAIKKRC